MTDHEARRPRAVPLGKRDPITDEELDRLAEITPEDIQSAKAAWRRHASPEFRDLLDAEPFGEDDRK